MAHQQGAIIDFVENNQRRITDPQLKASTKNEKAIYAMMIRLPSNIDMPEPLMALLKEMLCFNNENRPSIDLIQAKLKQWRQHC